jgi:HEAT repeat protein
MSCAGLVSPGQSWVDTVTVGPISEDLRRDRQHHRTEIVVAAHAGDPARARAALNEDDPGARALALGGLARCESLEVGDLERAAGDADPVVRRRAAEEAGRLRNRDPRPVAARLLGDEDDMVVEMAAWALGEHPPRATYVDALASVVKRHDESLCREAAVAALGALGDRRGLDAILAATEDRATVRRRAVLALAPFDGEEVDQALTAALDDRDWQVRQAAEDLLGPEAP